MSSSVSPAASRRLNAAGRQPPFERRGLAAEFGLAHRLVPWLQQIDGLDLGIELADVAGIGGAEKPGDEPFGPAAEG